MKILHYALGFPPIARGGLTKYVIDLMREQVLNGHTVGLLWPGEITNSASCKIRQHKMVNSMLSYELQNPLPLPQIYGISNITDFMENREIYACSEFLSRYKPDVIHIHTLMGLPQELLIEINNKKIRTIYTTHDFFGLCPKTTLFFNHISCCDNMSCVGCPECNAGALSRKKMVLLQSSLYRKAKELDIVKYIRKSLKKSKLQKWDIDYYVDKKNPKIEDYISLRNFYIGYLLRMSCIHFNSNYMRDIFLKFLNFQRYKVINITNSEIENHQAIKVFSSKKLRITYVGALAEYKGINILLDALDAIYAEKKGDTGFELHIYGETEIKKDYVINHRPYNYKELSDVMSKTDLLCVPRDVSFGFSVLEGMSYGVPVLVSNQVGAKDLIENEINGLIVEFSQSSIQNKIEEIISDRSILVKINRELVKNFDVMTIKEHNRIIEEELYRIR